MNRLLKALGLMRVSEHEAVASENAIVTEANINLRYRLREVNKALRHVESTRDGWKASATSYAEELASLRPDAQKWRDYLKRSRDRKAGKKA